MASSSSSLVANRRYTVPTPTLAWWATSLSVASKPRTARGFDDPLPVALGVLTQPAARFVNHAAEFSDLPYESQEPD
jgi:hypothetical protein